MKKFNLTFQLNRINKKANTLTKSIDLNKQTN